MPHKSIKQQPHNLQFRRNGTTRNPNKMWQHSISTENRCIRLRFFHILYISKIRSAVFTKTWVKLDFNDSIVSSVKKIHWIADRKLNGNYQKARTVHTKYVMVILCSTFTHTHKPNTSFQLTKIYTSKMHRKKPFWEETFLFSWYLCQMYW